MLPFAPSRTGERLTALFATGECYGVLSVSTSKESLKGSVRIAFGECRFDRFSFSLPDLSLGGWLWKQVDVRAERKRFRSKLTTDRSELAGLDLPLNLGSPSKFQSAD
ncbi:MAG: hypothetical protein IH851_03325 [Armatimonadetes bacterium]|nr:hypothetical protein [Armatimonadota bacterium]